jgi:uncharacterized protein (DUF488 family)
MALLTVGHSNRSLQEFLGLLAAHRVELLADIRTVPRSRHNPQFNRDALPSSLAAVGIAYLHLPALGGLRHAHKNSINTGWRNPSFRGFADYMQTAAFERALDELLSAAGPRRTALMCAEAVPWRCHRSLVADALLARAFPVGHIMGPLPPVTHKLTPFAQVVEGKVTYPTTSVFPENG